ncbi:MAG: hypothetical protein JOZ15_15970 [Acidobacteria bacterium]|nr:hypothetical protein [Acidobacteriota bacterium]
MVELHRVAWVALFGGARRPVRVRREEPALASFHPLILALCRQTRRFPGGDPLELGLGIRAAALGAAEAVLAACELPGKPIGSATALIEAVRRLRELACCLEVARRLGYLGDRASAELTALHGRAFRAVSELAERDSRRLRALAG